MMKCADTGPGIALNPMLADVPVRQLATGRERSVRSRMMSGAMRFSVAFVMLTLAGLTTAAEQSRKDLSGASLIHSNYSGCDLRHANIRNANLLDADFSNTDLRGADLTGAKLTVANFSGADLRGADLTGADLDRINLDGADLRGVIGWAKVELMPWLGISAKGANFSGTDLRDAKIAGGGSFEKANFSNADMTRAILEGHFHGALFDGATVSGAVMLAAVGIEPLREDLRRRGAIVTGKDFADAVKSGRDFSGARLTGDVQLQDIDLTGAKLKGADLGAARLHRTRLDGADLRKVFLQCAHVTEARFDGADLSRANLDEVHASGASFEGATLVGAAMDGADLTGANLRNADLTGANLTQANLTGADLTGAILDDVIVDAAILDDVKGLDPKAQQELHKRAGRWSYEFYRSLDRFLGDWSLPLHMLLTPLATLLAWLGLRTGFARGSYIALMSVNLGGAFPFLGILILPRLGIFGIGLLITMLGIALLACLASLAGGGFHIVRYVIMPPRNRPLLAVSTALLTMMNCFFALQTILMLPSLL